MSEGKNKLPNGVSAFEEMSGFASVNGILVS